METEFARENNDSNFNQIGVIVAQRGFHFHFTICYHTIDPTSSLAYQEQLFIKNLVKILLVRPAPYTSSQPIK